MTFEEAGSLKIDFKNHIGYIYMITCTITGHIYIGQSRQQPCRRLKGHRNQDSCSYFHRALAYHGEKNFTYEIVAFADTLEDLNKLEQQYIKKYNTLAPNGYNLVGGGGAKEVSDTWRATHQEAVIKATGRPLFCIEDNKEYRCVSEFCKAHPGFLKPGVIKACSGVHKSYKGLHMYYTDGSLEYITSIKKYQATPSKSHNITKKVLCVETGIIYNSVKEATRATGASHIDRCLKNSKQKSAKYHWKEVKEFYAPSVRYM